MLDPSSDLAVFARDGSRLVRETRERKEREKGTRDHVDVAGSSLGNIMGLKKKDDDAEDSAVSAAAASGGTSSQYGKFVDSKEEAVGEFGRSHTLQEQRRLLPIYDCRRDLMRLIAENQIVVIVGETGSGKTTQLTQYLYRNSARSFSRQSSGGLSNQMPFCVPRFSPRRKR